MMSLTVWLASSTLSNTPSMVFQAGGTLVRRSSTRVTIPNIPSQPMNAPHLVDELAASGKLKGLTGEVALTIDLTLQRDVEAALASHATQSI